MNKKLIGAVVFLAVLGVFAYVYNNGAPKSGQASLSGSQAAEPPVAVNPVPAIPSGKSGAEKEFTVSGQNYSFAPSTLTVKKGDKVKIIFKNGGGIHDFRIDEFNVATKRIRSGAEDTVEFTADKTGTFEYYCSVGSHRAMGMKGTLVVEE